MAKQTMTRGPRGRRGARGSTGARGPAGRAASPTEIVAAVADKFADIQQQLDVQLTRTGQIQAELDKYHKETRELRHELKAAHALLKDLLKVTGGAPASEASETNGLPSRERRKSN